MSNTITPRELGISDTIPRPKRTDWRIGVVGFGGNAGSHAPAYLEAGWQVVAVADPDPRARERAHQALPGARLYENYQDLELASHPFYAQCEGFLTVQWNNHLADLLRYWLAKDPVRVLACTRRMKGQNFKSDNLLLSIADYGDNVTGHITHSELLRSALGCARCRVDGDAGSLVFDLYGSDLTMHCARTGSEPCKLDLAGTPMASSFSGPMGDLLISLEEGREPVTSARRNLPTIRHVLAEERSARAGGAWIPL